jgi:hypothetical protein
MQILFITVWIFLALLRGKTTSVVLRTTWPTWLLSWTSSILSKWRQSVSFSHFHPFFITEATDRGTEWTCCCKIVHTPYERISWPNLRAYGIASLDAYLAYRDTHHLDIAQKLWSFVSSSQITEQYVKQGKYFQVDLSKACVTGMEYHSCSSKSALWLIILRVKTRRSLRCRFQPSGLLWFQDSI